jgi:predicted metal-dependent hydrolase
VQGLRVEVVRKVMTSVCLSVHPPDGRVRISVPLRLAEDAVRLAVEARLGWIRRQQERFAQQVQGTPHEWVSGERCAFQGRQYRLEVREMDAVPAVGLRDGATLELRVRPGSTRISREAVLQAWYRQQLRLLVPPLLARWEPAMGVRVAEWGIKRMKTRWGSCNPLARRIWLNLELAKSPPACLEYVVVHELLHLLERRHNQRFWRLMDGLLPQWRRQREALSRLPPEPRA